MPQTWKLARCRCARPHQDRDDCPEYPPCTDCPRAAEPGRPYCEDHAAARAVLAEMDAAPSQCWHYLHTLGGPRRCLRQPDYHDGPHEYPPAAALAG